jgi:hypothetical protein
MLDKQRYSFTERTDSLGKSVIMPYIPLTLTLGDRSVEVTALLDTGASVNVLPYEIGIQLGAVWENQIVSNSIERKFGTERVTRFSGVCHNRSVLPCSTGICLD